MAKQTIRERWHIEWSMLTAEAQRRRAADLDRYDIDPDKDNETLYEVFPVDDEAKARARAKSLVDGYQTTYGAVMLTKQAYLPVEGARGIFTWEDVTDVEYID